MNASFVVDCSVAITWLFNDEATAHTSKLLHALESETILVPALWYLEVTNVLAIAERQDRIKRDESQKFINELTKLDIQVDHEADIRAFEHLLPLCRAHHLTSYDASYVDLALRRKLPLATLDEPLRKAAKKLGVKLLGK